MSEVLLIGVSHHDREGPKKLNEALADFSPDIILVEGSQSKVDAQALYVQELRECIAQAVVKPEIGAILLEEQGVKGYEFEISNSYAQRRGAVLEYMDDSFEVRLPEQIRRMVRNLCQGVASESPDSLRKTLENSTAALKLFLASIRIAIDTPVEGMLVRLLPKHHINVGYRDAVMESALRARLQYERICSITGMAHILKTPMRNNLFCRVQDLNPKRKFI